MRPHGQGANHMTGKIWEDSTPIHVIIKNGGPRTTSQVRPSQVNAKASANFCK